MPTTSGVEIRTVADIFQTLTQCTKQEADQAEKIACQSPKAIATLAMACGISTGAIAHGGRLAVAGLALGGSVTIGGVLLAGAGLIGAKKYCKSLVANTSAALK